MKKTTLYAAICFCAAAPVFLAGCGGGGSAATNPPAAGSKAVSTSPVAGGGQYKVLLFSLSAPKKAYAQNEVVPLTLTVQNVGAQDLSIDYNPGGEVATADGKAVSPLYAPDNLPTAADNPDITPGVLPRIFSLVIPAGKTVSFALAWSQKDILFQGNARTPVQAAPGTYQVRGFINFDRTLATDALTIEIK